MRGKAAGKKVVMRAEEAKTVARAAKVVNKTMKGEEMQSMPEVEAEEPQVETRRKKKPLT